LNLFRENYCWFPNGFYSFKQGVGFLKPVGLVPLINFVGWFLKETLVGFNQLVILINPLFGLGGWVGLIGLLVGWLYGSLG